MDKFKKIEDIENRIINETDIEVLKNALLKIKEAIKNASSDLERYDFGDDDGVLAYDILIAIDRI